MARDPRRPAGAGSRRGSRRLSSGVFLIVSLILCGKRRRGDLREHVLGTVGDCVRLRLRFRLWRLMLLLAATALRTAHGCLAPVPRHGLVVHDDPRPAQMSHGSLKDSNRPRPSFFRVIWTSPSEVTSRNLVLGTVTAQALDHPAQDEVAIGLEDHVDEVDDDDPADVTQAQLANDLLGRLEVVFGDGLLEVSAGANELARVDVDHGHRLGAVDHEGTAGGQPHLAVKSLRDLLRDPVLIE